MKQRLSGYLRIKSSHRIEMIEDLSWTAYIVHSEEYTLKANDMVIDFIDACVLLE